MCYAQSWQHQKGSASQTVGRVFLPGQAVRMHQNIHHPNSFLPASSPSKKGYEPGRSSEHCPGRPHAQGPWEGASNKVVCGERRRSVKEGGVWICSAAGVCARTAVAGLDRRKMQEYDMEKSQSKQANKQKKSKLDFCSIRCIS